MSAIIQWTAIDAPVAWAVVRMRSLTYVQKSAGVSDIRRSEKTSRHALCLSISSHTADVAEVRIAWRRTGHVIATIPEIDGRLAIGAELVVDSPSLILSCEGVRFLGLSTTMRDGCDLSITTRTRQGGALRTRLSWIMVSLLS